MRKSCVNHRNAQALTVIEDMVQQRRLARAQKTGENGDGQAVISQWLIHHALYLCILSIVVG